jgi:dTDP-4-dehydrorhamnose 3,5-epimerase
VKFVIFDETQKKFFEIVLSNENYQRLTIKPGLWFAFQGLDKNINLVLNIADIEHNAEEVIDKNLKEIVYEW